MKTYIERIVLIVFLLSVVISLTACGESTEKKILGSWYDENMNELYFAEDGTYTIFNEGGTYSIEDDRIILIDPLGGAETFEYYEDGDEKYIYDTDGTWEFYPYDAAYEMNVAKAEAKEDLRVSTVDALKEYFVGRWVSQYDSSPVVIEVSADGSYKIIDDPYEDNKYRSDSGTWSFDEDWNDELWTFNATFKSYNSGMSEGKDYTDETYIYIPDYEDGDFSKLTIRMNSDTFIKDE